jgi:hypothetical protein
VLTVSTAVPELTVDTPWDGRPHTVSVRGLAPEALAELRAAGAPSWPGVLEVRTGDGDHAPGLPAVAGRYTLDEEGLHFTPHFAFVSGLRYTVRFRLRETSKERVFEVSAPPTPAPRVTAVFPSAEELPENTLRLYVQFDSPMAVRGAHRHVHLQDGDGREIPLAFVDLGDGLWDAGQTRLTLLFHPGRVKRGIAPGERLGPPLRAGGAYRVVVSGQLASTAGVSMGADFVRVFRATGADREPPDVSRLVMHPPDTASDPVRLELPEPLDQALQQRWIWVEDANGARVDGETTIGEGETGWVFRPARPWRPGRYTVRVAPALEDRAGNRFDRPFDRDLAAQPAVEETEPYRLPFDVR